VKVTIAEAATHLHVSQQTVRRRLASGVLTGEKQETPQGYRWVVEIVAATAQDPGQDLDLIAVLRDQLQEKDRQISELHQLLARTALPPPQTSPWWQFWR